MRRISVSVLTCVLLALDLTVAQAIGAQHPAVAVDSRSGDLSEEAARILARPVTLRLHEVSVHSAIDAVARTTNISVTYQDPVVDAPTKRVSLDVSGVPLRAVMEGVLSGTGLRLAVLPGNHFAVVPEGTLSRMPTVAGAILGRVVDSATGKGLRGAAVQVQGTKQGTVTNESGAFTLRDVATGEHVIMVKLFGYRPAQHSVTVLEGESVPLRITLSPVPTVLSGLVTTASGIQRKTEVGNDITRLNVDSLLHVAPITSVTDLLANRVPGLQVVRTSGTPGAPSRLRLRGVNSLSASNDPIVIVDGIRVFASQSDTSFGSVTTARVSEESRARFGGKYATASPLDQIDPNSIESIEVFKGPSSTAMYGSDAANGVIVITTKKGSAGPTRVSARLQQGVEYMPGTYPDVFFPFYHTSGGIVGNDPSGCARYITTCELDSTSIFQALNDPAMTVFGRGASSLASATISGGSGAFTYNFTGSGSAQRGLMKLPSIEKIRYQKFHGAEAPRWMQHPDRYATWSGGGTMTAQLSPKTSASLGSTLFHNAGQTSSLSGAIGALANRYVDRSTLDSVPLYSQFYERATSNKLTSTTAATVQSNTIRWLPLSATLGLNAGTGTDKILVPRGLTSGNADSAGFFSLGHREDMVTTLTLNAMSIPVSRFTTIGVGFNATTETDEISSSYTRYIPPGASEPNDFVCVPTSANTTGCSPTSTTSASNATYGWYTEPRFNWNSRLFITPGFRFDGGSNTGANAGLTGLPKINVSWIALDRAGADPFLGIISLFRPRVAFGTAGVQPGPAARLRLIVDTLVSTDGGATFSEGAGVGTLGNTRLRPERSTELEGGFDADLWGGRLSVQLSGYRKTRNDAIVDLPVASSVNGGGMIIQQNIGIVRNTGTELSLSGQPIQAKALSWNVSGNLTLNRNRVVRLAPGQTDITVISGEQGIEKRITAGYPLFGVWVKPILGYRDLDGDRIIRPSEVLVGENLVFVGQEDPNYHLGMTTNLTLFQRVTINAALDYTNGLTQYNRAGQGIRRALYDPSSSLGDQAVAVVAPRGVTGAPDYNNGLSATPYGLVQTVSTLRFSSLAVNYVVPMTFAHRVGAQGLTLSLQGNNLGLHTNYRGKDPNVNAYATGNQTADAGQLPLPRSWSLGFFVNF